MNNDINIFYVITYQQQEPTLTGMLRVFCNNKKVPTIDSQMIYRKKLISKKLKENQKQKQNTSDKLTWKIFIDGIPGKYILILLNIILMENTIQKQKMMNIKQYNQLLDHLLMLYLKFQEMMKLVKNNYIQVHLFYIPF